MNASKFFITSKRDNGDTFVTLADDAPEWLMDAVRECYQGAMPSDWVYEACRNAAESCDQDAHEWADSYVDVYTSDLFQWASDFCNSTLFASAEEEADDIGGTAGTIADRLRTVQYCALRQIHDTMAQAIADNNEEEDGDE